MGEGRCGGGVAGVCVVQSVKVEADRQTTEVYFFPDRLVGLSSLRQFFPRRLIGLPDKTFSFTRQE